MFAALCIRTGLWGVVCRDYGARSVGSPGVWRQGVVDVGTGVAISLE